MRRRASPSDVIRQYELPEVESFLNKLREDANRYPGNYYVPEDILFSSNIIETHDLSPVSKYDYEVLQESEESTRLKLTRKWTRGKKRITLVSFYGVGMLYPKPCQKLAEVRYENGEPVKAWVHYRFTNTSFGNWLWKMRHSLREDRSQRSRLEYKARRSMIG